MAKKLGSSILLYNCESQDYCWREAIASVKAFADELVILDAGSTDQTAEMAKEYEDEKTKVICLPNSEWSKMRGKEKLSHFTNMAKEMLSTEWHFNIQADEVVSEKSIPYIKMAIEQDEEGFFCRRVNLWGDSRHHIKYGHPRMPVGDTIIRLAKTKYYSVDDAEGIFTGGASYDFFENIQIYHMGFVRNKYIHTKKIEHMLTKVFGMGMDKSVEEMNGVFNPWSNFTKEDVVPIKGELPIYVREWAKVRDEINGVVV